MDNTFQTEGTAHTKTRKLGSVTQSSNGKKFSLIQAYWGPGESYQMGQEGEQKPDHGGLINHFLKFRFYTKSNGELYKKFKHIMCIGNIHI